METLLDVNLQHVPDDFLVGTWRVSERVLSQAGPTTPLAQATFLPLDADGLRLETPTAPVPGPWAVARDALLSRPHLELRLAAGDVIALVTRLRRTSDGLLRTLVLCFQSGMVLFVVYPQRNPPRRLRN